MYKKIKTSKDVANEIIERMNDRLRNEGIGQRDKETKEIFTELLEIVTLRKVLKKTKINRIPWRN
ncbi:hypothetical protein [Floridanema evergladense]|uniref:Cytochrome P450 n=1 Tax=Floridaenema evergladense BLCC-F167 TaxID=3153639 RepID=A0ABV4WNS6_9CYAN